MSICTIAEMWIEDQQEIQSIQLIRLTSVPPNNVQ